MKRKIQVISIGDLLKLFVLQEKIGNMTNRALMKHPELVEDSITIPALAEKLETWREENNVCLCKLILVLTVMILEKAEDNIISFIDKESGTIDEETIEKYTIH